MSRWTLSLTHDRDAYCPMCGTDLIPQATCFRWGMAHCTICAKHALMGHLECIAKALSRETKYGNTTSVNGLIFWTPKVYAVPRTSLIMKYSSSVDWTERDRQHPDVTPPTEGKQ